MTPSRPPTWREFERFLAIDGWVEVRRTGHVFYEKTLPEGEILQTHRSLAGDKSMGMGRFRQILTLQLKASVPEFWQALATGDPVPRPSREPERAPAALPAWLAMALEREVGLRRTEIEHLDHEAAWALLDHHRARPQADALYGANLDEATVAAILDAIPGAWESVARGEEDAKAGRVIPVEDL